MHKLVYLEMSEQARERERSQYYNASSSPVPCTSIPSDSTSVNYVFYLDISIAISGKDLFENVFTSP